MGDFADTAIAILTASERRLEVSAQNISNLTTPGYKRRVSFDSVLNAASPTQASPSNTVVMRDFSLGKIMDTASPGDLAMSQSGFFVVRNDNGLLYTRQGSFHRDGEGHLVTTQGWPVQAAGGGDIVLKTDAFKVLPDGTVTEGGEAVARLAVMDFAGARTFEDAESGFFRAPEAAMAAVDTPSIRQGALETSNVSTADEMIGMMSAIRRAEAGQKLINVYDDLLGRAISTFGQA